jgi:carboxysome shell carbonic anhydrase
MLRTRYRQQRQNGSTSVAAPRRRPGAVGYQAEAVALSSVPTSVPAATYPAAAHALTRRGENARLFDYERRVKSAFDAIVPTLKQLAALQHEADFETRASALARQQLGFELPADILADAWVTQLDMRSLFAWCVFETYRRFADDFFSTDPLGNMAEATAEGEFQALLQDCGFHILDVSPCADGRLAHVIRYVLRLPYRAVRRKSYAGAMFDIEDSIEKWVETELLRFREGRPNTADAATRYLKAAVYHFSSMHPEQEGCAAHGSDAERAAEAGLQRLLAFQKAIQNSFCCGASIDLMLIGLDTDRDAIRIHVPDANGVINLADRVCAAELYQQTLGMDAARAEAFIAERVAASADATPGMQRLITRLLINNLSQIEYVRECHGQHYQDIGHAERFIGAGIGFEEVQLRNLTYFAYLNTVEEAVQDLDVGVKIFTRLNVSHGLPIPVVVSYNYHGNVPGARERAMQHCQRVEKAMLSRYSELANTGLLHTLRVVRDCNAGGRLEVTGSSLKKGFGDGDNKREAH